MVIANIILFDYVIKNCLIPGKIENWIFIIDANGMGIGDVDRKGMRQVMMYLGSLFKCRARRSICVNASKMIYCLWAIMKVFVNEGVKVKFSMTDSHTHEDLSNMVHPS